MTKHKGMTMNKVIVDGFDLTAIAKQVLSTIRCNRDSMNDFMQIAYMAMFRVLRDGLVRDDMNPCGYLYRVARNAVLKHLDRYVYKSDNNKHKARLLPDVSDNGAARLSIESKIDRDIALSLLPEHYRRVVVMFLNGHKVPEIATLEGVTPTAIRVRLKKAAAKIRETLSARA